MNLPPQPSQEWLQEFGYTLTGECRAPMPDETFHSPQFSGEMAISQGTPEKHVYEGVRWILLRKLELGPTPPSKDQLEARGVEIAAGPLPWATAKKTWPSSRACWYDAGMKEWRFTTLELRDCGSADVTNPTYAIRKRAPSIKPWTLDTVPLPLNVRQKGSKSVNTVLGLGPNGGVDGVILFRWESYEAAVSAAAGGKMPGYAIKVSFAALLEKFEQRDGSPCGEVVP